MNILHHMKKEKSGLAVSTLELCKYEERKGHRVVIKQPTEDMAIYGVENGTDIHCIHSQIHPKYYQDGKPKIMWMHGEPLSSVGNGVSMKAIVDLAPVCDAFICMREEEWPVWNSIRTTYVVNKGIDLEKFHPLPGITERLSGEPAVLYIENWRGQRNPLYLCLAMQEVYKKYPNARLHLYNVTDKRMLETFQALIKNNKWWTFIRSIQGPVDDVNLLYNRVDMVVSCLFPLYARGIEAFGAGRAFVGPGYKVDSYPYQCDLDPRSMADAIMRCWEEYGTMDFRKWAEGHHDANEMAKQAIDVYTRYV